VARTIPIFAQKKAATVALAEFRVSPPLALYVHVPWCVQKCPYCDFNSHEAGETIPEREYVDALIADLQSALPLIWGRPVQTVFFGGGTPSLLSPAAIDELIAAFRALAMLAPDAEITLEANPGTVEAEKFAGFRAAGVNRLSLGIQSFNDEHLKALGRIHGADEAKRAAQLAGEHFDSFNLDLMYGLPGQTHEQALTDIETALGFSPSHLSCYQLTLEPNTRFAAFPPELPEGDICADMQEAIEARLATAGLRQLRNLGLRAARQAVQAQPELLVFRRLPRHRRRRPLQADAARPRAAPDAPQTPEGLPGKHPQRQRRPGRQPGSKSASLPFRIPDERAAPGRRLPPLAVRGAHRAIAERTSCRN
jgi:coproporphyrinogen III oxidase-like Fe-S oxidoreductase